MTTKFHFTPAQQGSSLAPISTPDGSVISPDGSVTSRDGTIISPDGTVTAPDGTITTPQGIVAAPDGTVLTTADGSLAPGAIAAPDGTITLPPGVNPMAPYNPGNYAVNSGIAQSGVDASVSYNPGNYSVNSVPYDPDTYPVNSGVQPSQVTVVPGVVPGVQTSGVVPQVVPGVPVVNQNQTTFYKVDPNDPSNGTIWYKTTNQDASTVIPATLVGQTVTQTTFNMSVSIFSAENKKLGTFNVPIPEKPLWKSDQDVLHYLAKFCNAIQFNGVYGVTPSNNQYPLYALEGALYPWINPVMRQASGWDLKLTQKWLDLASVKRLNKIEKKLDSQTSLLYQLKVQQEKPKLALVGEFANVCEVSDLKALSNRDFDAIKRRAKTVDPRLLQMVSQQLQQKRQSGVSKQDVSREFLQLLTKFENLNVDDVDTDQFQNSNYVLENGKLILKDFDDSDYSDISSNYSKSRLAKQLKKELKQEIKGEIKARKMLRELDDDRFDDRRFDQFDNFDDFDDRRDCSRFARSSRSSRCGNSRISESRHGDIIIRSRL
ncbi:hypothetical protein CJU89_2940 [Yarrowia sp. B02]|nr:hypothetical protein CJU89_2940 [Yarrowia sp. B02]